MTDLLRLSDRDMELIVRRVMEEIRRQRVLARRWRIGLVATLVTALVASVAAMINEVEMLGHGVRGVQERVDVVEDRPYIEGMATPFNDAEHLVINGSAFGDEPGFVELFYKRTIVEIIPGAAQLDPGATRSPTVILSGDLVVSWTDEQIAVNTTPDQRRVILDRLRAEGFEDLIPYVRVVTAAGRRSSLW